MKKVIALLALFCMAVYAQDTFTDPRDGKKYKSAKIGKQTWMAQNLDYHGEDGFLGLCYGDEPKKKIKKPENCKKYGRLYDWNEAIKACPKGWHLPSNKEWQTLVDFAGGDDVAGKKLKAKNGWQEHDFLESYKSSGIYRKNGLLLEGELKSEEELERELQADLSKKNVSYKRNSKSPKCKWTEEEIDNRGRVMVKEHDKCTTDEYSFSALPGGCGDGNSGGFFDVSKFGFWWSATEGLKDPTCHSSDGDAACGCDMSYEYEGASCRERVKFLLFSVRCVKD